MGRIGRLESGERVAGVAADNVDLMPPGVNLWAFNILDNPCDGEVVTQRARSNELSRSLGQQLRIGRQSRLPTVQEYAWRCSDQYRPTVVARICPTAE